MTVAELIRELETFQPDSTVMLAVATSDREWAIARPAIVYWTAEAKVVAIESEGV